MEFLNCPPDSIDITVMKDISRSYEHLKSQVVDSGTVVFDGKGIWIQEFPTEEEALEFIEEQGNNENTNTSENGRD